MARTKDIVLYDCDQDTLMCISTDSKIKKLKTGQKVELSIKWKKRTILVFAERNIVYIGPL
jgi:Ser-tRNA(Ala) deacylase AlaX